MSFYVSFKRHNQREEEKTLIYCNIVFMRVSISLQSQISDL